MLTFKLIALLYGIFLLIGGFFGRKAGSRVSLFMATAAGITALASALLTDINYALALELLSFIALVLSFVFLKRLFKTKKVMPSGMLLVISFAVLAFSILQIFQK